MPSQTSRIVLEVLDRLGIRDQMYGVVIGARLEVLFKHGNLMSWYRGTITRWLGADLEIQFDDNDTHVFSVDEFVDMYQKGELRKIP
jgi:hypothetical protein